MPTVHETMGQRIKKERQARQWTQIELAKKIQGVSGGAISQWESDITKPNAENLYELSKIFNCDFVWLLKGHGESQSDAQSPAVSYANITTGHNIPIIQTKVLEKVDNTQLVKLTSNEYIMTDFEISEFAFAVRIEDISMSPEFMPNDIVVIDPQVKPEPGEFVLAQSKQGIIFRKYKLHRYLNNIDHNFILTPLNDDYPDI